MSEVTLESLAKRVEALEQVLGERSISGETKDWRRVAGLFGDSDFMKQVDAEGRSIREAERENARRGESEA